MPKGHHLWSLMYNHFTFKVPNQLVYYACHLMAQTQKLVFVQQSNWQVHVLWQRVTVQSVIRSQTVYISLQHVYLCWRGFVLHPYGHYWLPTSSASSPLLHSCMPAHSKHALLLHEINMLCSNKGARYLTRFEKNILHLLKCKMLLKCYSCPCINKQFIYHVGYQNINLTTSWYKPV